MNKIRIGISNWKWKIEILTKIVTYTYRGENFEDGIGVQISLKIWNKDLPQYVTQFYVCIDLVGWRFTLVS